MKTAATPRPTAKSTPREGGIVAELKALNQWVVWRYELRGAKWTKIPYDPKGRPKYEDGKARSGDPETWGTYLEALARFSYQTIKNEDFAGIGFEFADDGGLAGVDFDQCLDDDGQLLPWAAPLVADLGPDYLEISPSRRGLKAIVRGRLPGPGTRRPAPGGGPNAAVEMYDHGRFFTITGGRFGTDAPDLGPDRSAELADLYRRIKPPKGPKKAPGAARVGPLGDDDEKLLEKARTARNGAGDAFRALFDRGDTSRHLSGSEADFALLIRLAFWTRHDPERMERLFDRSVLGQRDKWRDRADYRDISIRNAIDAQADAYDPQPRTPPNGQHHVNGNGQHHEANGQPATEPKGYEALKDEDMGIVAADGLDMERVEHLWADRLYVGKIDLLAGEGGDGKSQYASRIAASITRGDLPLPDGTMPTLTGTVLILAAEDGQRDTVLPRLAAVGADLKNVRFITAKVTTRAKDGTPLVHFASFQDLDYWREVFRRVKGVRLLIADPIPAYLGRGVNDHKNQEVRTVLEPFAELLSENRVAMMGITHLGKSPDLKTPSHKILGSVAYCNLARSVHITARDPDDKDRRVVCQIKNNLGPLQPALAFRIREAFVDHKGAPLRTSMVEFEGTAIEADAAELLDCNRNPAKKRGPSPEKTRKLAEWLWDYMLARGGVLLAAIFDAAGEQGFLGTKKDGKWSVATNLYNARNLIPQLDGGRKGYVIDDFKAPLGEQGRPLVHWQLIRADGQPF